MRIKACHRSGLLHLGLVLVWFQFVELVLLPGLSLSCRALKYKSGALWNRLGVTSAGIMYEHSPSYDIYPFDGSLRKWSLLSDAFGRALLVGLFAWLAFRLIVRRPRPRWYRFSRYGWRSCIYATAFLALVFLIGSLLPPISFQITNNNFVCLDLILVPPLILYAVFAPTVFAKLEFWRRAKRIWRVCPNCDYPLRSIAVHRCPECGTAVTKSLHGGWIESN